LATAVEWTLNSPYWEAHGTTFGKDLIKKKRSSVTGLSNDQSASTEEKKGNFHYH